MSEYTERKYEGIQYNSETNYPYEVTVIVESLETFTEIMESLGEKHKDWRYKTLPNVLLKSTGSYGSVTVVPAVTVNAKGLITTAVFATTMAKCRFKSKEKAMMLKLMMA